MSWARKFWADSLDNDRLLSGELEEDVFVAWVHITLAVLTTSSLDVIFGSILRRSASLFVNAFPVQNELGEACSWSHTRVTFDR